MTFLPGEELGSSLCLQVESKALGGFKQNKTKTIRKRKVGSFSLLS